MLRLANLIVFCRMEHSKESMSWNFDSHTIDKLQHDIWYSRAPLHMFRGDESSSGMTLVTDVNQHEYPHDRIQQNDV